MQPSHRFWQCSRRQQRYFTNHLPPCSSSPALAENSRTISKYVFCSFAFTSPPPVSGGSPLAFRFLFASASAAVRPCVACWCFCCAAVNTVEEAFRLIFFPFAFRNENAVLSAAVLIALLSAALDLCRAHESVALRDANLPHAFSRLSSGTFCRRW